MVLSTCALLSLLVLCGGMRLLGTWLEDETTLAGTLQQIIDLTDDTIAVAAQGLDVTPNPGNGSVEGVRKLRNNYSLDDKSMYVEGNYDPVNFGPIYNDCDSWRNLLFDGWSTGYSVKIKLRDTSDGDALLRRAMTLWESRGYQVSQHTYETTRWTGPTTISAPTMEEVERLSDPAEQPTVLTIIQIEQPDDNDILDGFNLEVDKKFKEATLGGGTGCRAPGNG